MSELRSAVESLRSEVVAELPDARIEEDFAELHRAVEQLEVERLRRLAEIERRRLFERDGHLSAAAWLAHTFKVAWGPGSRRCRRPARPSRPGTCRCRPSGCFRRLETPTRPRSSEPKPNSSRRRGSTRSGTCRRWPPIGANASNVSEPWRVRMSTGHAGGCTPRSPTLARSASTPTWIRRPARPC